MTHLGEKRGYHFKICLSKLHGSPPQCQATCREGPIFLRATRCIIASICIIQTLLLQPNFEHSAKFPKLLRPCAIIIFLTSSGTVGNYTVNIGLPIGLVCRSKQQQCGSEIERSPPVLKAIYALQIVQARQCLHWVDNIFKAKEFPCLHSVYALVIDFCTLAHTKSASLTPSSSLGEFSI